MNSTSASIRPATASDADAIAAIYAPIVRDTWISFEESPPDAAEMRSRIASAERAHAFLVYERDGEIAGYAYASRHRERAAYRWSVDVSVYVHEAHRRLGVAQKLYSELLERSAQLGYYTAFAGITLPNDASVGFHRSFGFEDVGIYRNVGYKLGAWHDTIWLQRPLRPTEDPPTPPPSP